MKRFPKILAATCAVLALSASAALAADAPKAAAKPVPAAQGMAPMATGGQMGLAGLSPEKQELATAIMNEHRDALFPLHQSVYAKNAELEALNAAGNGDSAKAKSVIREIADLNARMLIENGRFRARLVKETGLRTAPMGHGMMGGMMGGMKCQMMSKMAGKMMGDMQHGAAPVVPGAPAAPASGHDAHGN